MRIGVGSGNPVKRDATVQAVEAADDDVSAAATVEACPVPSGVSEQPTGHGETRRGARNRAEAVVEEGYDVGVGIEGGVAEYAGVGGDAGGGADRRGADAPLFLVMWAAVTDGDRWGDGTGPSLVLPAGIADRVRGGEELGPVMDDVLGESDVAKNQGAAGALTGGRVDRADALAAAVSGALGPFVTDLYDD
ncbi:DUF84 family protein [Halobaculum sp. D14]|uniref:DUF84 family protein n=1 Tax=Halobaculum sp. D14 TaxID=3421642 RepID=UPI003EBCB664